MKRVAVVLSSLGVFGVANAQSLRSQIEAMDRKIDRQMMAKDVKGVTATMKAAIAPDFKYVEAGKSEGFETMAQGMAMGLGGMRSLSKAEAKLLTLKQIGDAARGTTRHTMVGTIMGPDKKPHTMAFSGTSTETYVKQGGKWKIASMTWIEQKTLMDGKPVGGSSGGSKEEM